MSPAVLTRVKAWSSEKFSAGPLGGVSGYHASSTSDLLKIRSTPLPNVAFWTGAIAALLLGPMLFSQNQISIANVTLVAVIGALGTNLIVGLAGQISLASAALLAVGAFSGGLVGATQGLPLLLCIPVAAFAGAIGGLIMGIPALRFRGLYLILASLAFHYIVSFVAHAVESGRGVEALTGLILTRADLGVVVLRSPSDFLVFLVIVAALVTVGFLNLMRSQYGRAWVAIRDHEVAVSALGVPAGYLKLKAFAFSGAVIAVAGVLGAYLQGVVTSEQYTLNLAIEYLAMVVIGGLGTALGSWLGAIFVSSLPFALDALFDIFNAPPEFQSTYLAPLQTLMFATLMAIFIVWQPQGLAGLWHKLRTYLAAWPLRQE